MRAMILAAGRGSRMLHLTADLPKALLRVKNQYLIEYPIRTLASSGIHEIVINVCYKADLIKAALGSGSQYGVNIIYSDEEEPLETGGGIFKALPLLRSDPFVVLSCDVICDYPLKNLPTQMTNLAHLILVNNPAYHPQGDFCLKNKKIYVGNDPTYTFGNIGVYKAELFRGCQPGKFRLGDILRKASLDHQVTGEHYSGFWQNIGTPEQLLLAE